MKKTASKCFLDLHDPFFTTLETPHISEAEAQELQLFFEAAQKAQDDLLNTDKKPKKVKKTKKSNPSDPSRITSSPPFSPLSPFYKLLDQLNCLWGSISEEHQMHYLDLMQNTGLPIYHANATSEALMFENSRLEASILENAQTGQLKTLKRFRALLPDLFADEHFQARLFDHLLVHGTTSEEDASRVLRTTELFLAFGFSLRPMQGLYQFLHHVINAGLVDVVDLLIHHDPELHLQNKGPRGYYPLHLAACNDNPQILEALLKAGHHVNLQDEASHTPLFYLLIGQRTHSNTYGLVQLLLSHGADATLLTQDKWSILHYAALYSSPEVISLLVQHGAPLHVKNKNGNTPLELAQKYGNTNTIEAFKAIERSLLEQKILTQIVPPQSLPVSKPSDEIPLPDPAVSSSVQKTRKTL